jgi:glyoxylate reductase
MTLKKIFITRNIPEPAEKMLKDVGYEVTINLEDRVLTKAELIESIKDVDGVLCLLTDPIDREVLAAAKKAKVFANYAVGYNNIDIKAASELGIIVTNTPGVLTDATADLAWALLFSVARRVVEADKFTREGKFDGWAPNMFLGGDITGKTLGIVGAGRIGMATALKSQGFDMKVLYTGNSVNKTLEEKISAQKVDLETLLKESDFVSLHVPLNEKTKHLIGKDELNKMRKTAYLINTARGLVVDEVALIEALKAKKIAGAGFDVYEDEPQLKPGLVDLDNVVILPHIASATHWTRGKMAQMAAQNLIDVLEGRSPENKIN